MPRPARGKVLPDASAFRWRSVEAAMRLIKLPEVVRMTGVPESFVYWRISRNEFPRSIKIGERASAWRSDEIEAWIAAKVAAARAAA